MTNLIVTIMAIGMAAIVAMAGAFYAGNAFIMSFSKAQATQMVNYLGTYAQAANVWAQRNGGVLPEPANNLPITASNNSYFSKAELDGFLVPRFLQANNLPGNMLSSAPYFYFWKETASSMANPVLVGFLSPNDISICKAVEMLRTNTLPASLRTYIVNPNKVNTDFCGNFGCLANNGTFGATGTFAYIVYYRTHGTPNINFPDVDPNSCT